MSSATLHELTDTLRGIESSLAETGGELTPELEVALDEAEGNVEEKVEGICFVIQELNAKSKAAKEESDRLRKLAATRANAAKSLKGYLRFHMERVDRTEFDLPRFRVKRIANGRPSVRLVDDSPEAIPARFSRVRVEVDTQAIYEELKDSGRLPSGVGSWFISLDNDDDGLGPVVAIERGEHVRIW